MMYSKYEFMNLLFNQIIIFMLKHLTLFKRLCKPISFIMIWIMATAMLYAQTNTITGVVTSADDKQPIPGVTVVIKGTTKGTITDLDGKYALQAGPADTLAFTFVGMKPQFHAVGAKKTIDIVMKSAATLMDEVVVIGYGTESKKLLTGAISSVNADDIKYLPTPTVDAVLQGKTTGVFVSQNSGTPGGGISVRIRGVTSINAGNHPLYIIDGIPVVSGNLGQIGFSGQTINAISDLNPEDIESISVLKDAAAASIYGARGANGVVLITTKKGKTEKTKVTASAYYGWAKMWKKLEMLNAEQYQEYRKELTGSAIDPSLPNVNWIDEVTRTAPVQNYEVTTSGGSEKTAFYFSGSYFKEDGVLIGTSYNRFSGRLNLDHTANNNLKFGMGYHLSSATNKRVEGDQSLNGVLPNAISMAPTISVYDKEGNYNETGFYANPVAIANEAINTANSNRNLANFYVDWKIIDKLMFKTKWGIDNYILKEHSFDPPTTRQGARYNGQGIEANAFANKLTSNNYFSWERQFVDVHNFDAVLGYSFEKYNRKNDYIQGRSFPSEKFEYLESATTIVAARSSKLDRGSQSYFSRLKYNYKYKYLLTINSRIDGSSRFGKNNQYGFFPGVSLGWRIYEESFFKAVPYINDCKLKLSWGRTGNDDIPDFRHMALYNNTIYGDLSGLYLSQLASPDLKWETTNQTDVGLEVNAFQDKIVLVIDYYNKQTNDILLSRPLPPSSGFASIMDNIGAMENKGIEIGLQTKNMDKQDFIWSSSLNFSTNKNKVKSLYEDQPIMVGGRGQQRIEVGKPISYFYGYKSLGVDPSTGDMVFEDINGDGVITANDQTMIGNPHPDFVAGFTNNFSYKNFEVSLFLQCVYGNDIFNGNRIYLEALKGEDNQTTAVLDRWKTPGDITDIPRATNSDPNNNNRISNRFIEDGTYLRVKNLTIAYNLDKKILKYVKLSSARVYFTGSNLLTFTKYSGMDPEVNYAGDSNLTMSTDFFTYPQVRKIIFGINIGL